MTNPKKQSAEAAVRTIRRRTRRKFSPEEKIRIVLEGFRRELTVNDLCRREGINPASYYPFHRQHVRRRDDLEWLVVPAVVVEGDELPDRSL